MGEPTSLPEWGPWIKDSCFLHQFECYSSSWDRVYSVSFYIKVLCLGLNVMLLTWMWKLQFLMGQKLFRQLQCWKLMFMHQVHGSGMNWNARMSQNRTHLISFNTEDVCPDANLMLLIWVWIQVSLEIVSLEIKVAYAALTQKSYSQTLTSCFSSCARILEYLLELSMLGSEVLHPSFGFMQEYLLRSNLFRQL